MTYEEMKTLANSMGYNLTPKYQRKEKLLPCICGSKKHMVFKDNSGTTHRGIKIRCRVCGRGIAYIDNKNSLTMVEIEKKARQGWNRAMKKGE